MPRRISSDTRRTRLLLSDVSTLIQKGVRAPFSLAAFITLASALIEKISQLHQDKQAFPLSLKGLTVSYHSTSKTYRKLHVIEVTDEPLMRNLYNINKVGIYKDEYQLSRTLDMLFQVTQISTHEKTEAIIAYIVANELQAFLLRCDHYQNTDITQSLLILSTAFNAIQKLLDSPSAEKLAALDISAVQHSAYLPKILGSFIQESADRSDFNEVLVNFLIQRTTTHDSLSQSILRGAPLEKIMRTKDKNPLPDALFEENFSSMSKRAYRNSMSPEAKMVDPIDLSDKAGNLTPPLTDDASTLSAHPSQNTFLYTANVSHSSRANRKVEPLESVANTQVTQKPHKNQSSCLSFALSFFSHSQQNTHTRNTSKIVPLKME